MDESFASSAPAQASTPAPSTTTSQSAPSASPAPSSTPSTSQSYSGGQESHTPSQPQGPQVVAQSRTESGSGGRQQLVIDQYGRRVVRVNNNNSAPEPSPQGQEPMGVAGQPQETVSPWQQQAQSQQPQGQPLTGDMDAYIRDNNIQPAKYNLDEFSAALASGNIDSRRVPDQYKAQYEAFKINQAVEQYNANQKAVEAQKRAEVEKQLTPEQKAQNMQDFYSSLEKEAETRARQDAMLTDEDIADLPYMDESDPKLIAYNQAKNFHRNQLMFDLQRRAAEDDARRIQQENVYKGINAFVTEAKIKEPNFDAIDVMMKTRYQSLPYQEGQRIATVIEALNGGNITEEQTMVLKEYYDKCRREYYAQRNGLSTSPQPQARPPIVERAGGNDAPPQQYVPDYNALRNANGPRERRQWVLQFMRANRNR